MNLLELQQILDSVHWIPTQILSLLWPTLYLFLVFLNSFAVSRHSSLLASYTLTLTLLPMPLCSETISLRSRLSRSQRRAKPPLSLDGSNFALSCPFWQGTNETNNISFKGFKQKISSYQHCRRHLQTSSLILTTISWFSHTMQPRGDNSNSIVNQMTQNTS